MLDAFNLLSKLVVVVVAGVIDCDCALPSPFPVSILFFDVSSTVTALVVVVSFVTEFFDGNVIENDVDISLFDDVDIVVVDGGAGATATDV